MLLLYRFDALYIGNALTPTAPRTRSSSAAGSAVCESHSSAHCAGRSTGILSWTCAMRSSAFCVRIVNAASGSPAYRRYSPAMYMTGPSAFMACLILRFPCACHSK